MQWWQGVLVLAGAAVFLGPHLVWWVQSEFGIGGKER